MTDGHGNRKQIRIYLAAVRAASVRYENQNIRTIERRISLAGVIHLSDEYKTDGLPTGFTRSFLRADVWITKPTGYSDTRT
jgi:hypothetical protein